MPVALKGSTSGEVVLTAPAVAGTTTITLPAETGNAVVDSATQTLTNKTLTSPNINGAQIPTVSGTAPLYMARAWVNFNGTGTVGVLGGGNVTSVTDNAAGVYTINFTTNMPDINYAAGMFLRSDTATRNATIGQQPGDTFSTSSLLVRVATHNGAANVYGVDAQIVTIAIFR